jgi:uncharacterized protein (DUF1330 family)
MDVNALVDQMLEWYGFGLDGSAPQPAQWRRLFAGDWSQPVTLINFFKFAEHSQYPDGRDRVAGPLAFERYSAVSVPALSAVGGKFLIAAPMAGSLMGDEAPWDLVAIGTYPDRHALVSLYQNADYRAAYEHRRAACARQQVLIVNG